MNLREVQENTVIGIVNKIFDKGQFDCSIKEEVKKDEVIIGTCTDYEKAMSMAIENLSEKDWDLPSEEMVINTQINAIYEMLIASISMRITLHTLKISFRKDWVIVEA